MGIFLFFEYLTDSQFNRMIHLSNRCRYQDWGCHAKSFCYIAMF